MSDFFEDLQAAVSATVTAQLAQSLREYGINDTCATSLGFAGRRFELSMERLILGHRN